MQAPCSRPLRQYGLPSYPTKLAALADPDLLRRHVPRAWLSQRDVAALAGVLVAAGFVGCRPASATASPNGSSGAAFAAPVFEHGEGLAPGRLVSFDGAPPSPVYLSEADALRVITDELKRAGLDMSAQNVKLWSVIIRGRELHQGYDWVAGSPGRAFSDVAGPLEVDLYDPGRHIAVKYVGLKDFDRLGGRDDEAHQWMMDLKGVAASVECEVARQARGMFFGTFYDPVVEYRYEDFRRLVDAESADETDRPRSAQGLEAEVDRLSRDRIKQVENILRQRASYLLRQQVNDFVDWLKAQGAI
jgi:hypothetical protein